MSRKPDHTPTLSSNSSRVRAALANTSYLVFAEATKPALSFLLILVISRTLGREGMGTYTIILSISALFELLATAGLPIVIVRGIAADRSRLSYYMSASAGVAILTTLILLPLVEVFLRLLHYPPPIETGIRWLTFTIVLTTIQQYTIAICEGLQNMKLRAGLSTCDTLGRLIIGVVMIFSGHGIIGIIQGMIAVRALTTAIAVIILRRQATLSFPVRDLISHSVLLLRTSLPFLVTLIANTLFWSINTIMLSKMVTVEQVGVYNAAYRLMDIARTIFFSYLIVLLPMMAASFTESLERLKHECEMSIKYLALAAIPLATATSVLADRIVRLIYGPKFAAAVPLLQVLIWTACVFCIVLVLARLLVASNNQISDLFCNIVAVLVNIGLGWVLIRAFGALGAGIADLVSLAVFGALEYLIVARRLFAPDVLGPIGRALAASGTMAIALYATRTYPLFLTLLAGAAVYALALIALRTFSAEERTMISELINDACHRLLPTELRPADGAGD